MKEEFAGKSGRPAAAQDTTKHDGGQAIDEAVQKVLHATDDEALEKSVEEVRRQVNRQAAAKGKPPIREDEFIKRILSKMPSRVRNSFTEEQLFAIKTAFGAFKWSDHKIDVRGTFSFLRWQMYYVLIAGKDRRTERRLEEPMSRSTRVYVLGTLLWLTIVCGAAVLYVIKSLLGIDLIPGHSFGLFDWIRNLF